MKRYTYSAARQRLSEVLEEASRKGMVEIRRQDGRMYAVTPVASSPASPFARVTGGAVTGTTAKDLVRFAREQGRIRGARVAGIGRKPRDRRAKRR